MQGKFIAQYTTCLEAAREVGIASNYIACAANPNVKTKTAKGYQWRYRDDSIFARGIKDIEPVKMENLAPVLQFDLNGRYITQYVSIKEATDKTGITGDLISAAARGKVKTAKGFQWRYLDDPLFTHGIVNIAPVKRLKYL